MKTFYKYRIKIDTRADGTKLYYAQVMEYTALTLFWSVITLPFKIIFFLFSFGDRETPYWYFHFQYDTIDKVRLSTWLLEDKHPELYVMPSLQEAEDIIHAHKKRMDHLEEISKNKVRYIPPSTITKTEYKPIKP